MRWVILHGYSPPVNHRHLKRGTGRETVTAERGKEMEKKAKKKEEETRRRYSAPREQNKFKQLLVIVSMFKKRSITVFIVLNGTPPCLVRAVWKSSK